MNSFLQWDQKSLNQKIILTIILIPVLIVIVSVFQQTQLSAYANPDTDACAQCHRSHTASSEYLSMFDYQNQQCMTCHNGTGSVLNVEIDFNKRTRHSLGGRDYDSNKQCASCHESHLHIYNNVPNLVDPRNTRFSWEIVGVTDSNYDSASSPSGSYMWCQTCHARTADSPVGTLILSVSANDFNYVPFNVQVSALTSYAQVDNNGETDPDKYWQFFSSETTGTIYGYNDSSAIGESAHGKSSSSQSATEKFTVWKGQFNTGFPALDCRTCHAQHGSDQPWMILDSIEIEGEPRITGYDMTTAEGQKQFCETCHTGTYENCDLSQKCTDCHRHGNRF